MASEWRDSPQLKGRFLLDYPDDLQVIVHDGGPRLSQNPAEVVWVRVTGQSGDTFRGHVLNQPNNLRGIRQGAEIRFVVADGAEFPVLVTDKYLRERGRWVIHACDKCGFAELFDAPSDLIRVVFPNQPAGAETDMFTAFCPLCGGVQVLEAADRPGPADEAYSTPKRPWWRFWG